MPDIVQDIVVVLKLVAASLVVEDAPVLAEDAEREAIVDVRIHYEGRL